MSETNDLGLTDAGLPRKRKGKYLGWSKNKKNMDIRELMKERGIGQVTLGKILGMNTKNVNHLLNRDLEWNIHDCIVESIKRYDPETNPHGR